MSIKDITIVITSFKSDKIIISRKFLIIKKFIFVRIYNNNEVHYSFRQMPYIIQYHIQDL